ncbi:DUF86 domain-containing protein [Aequorivita sp. SDUM287046]|uniref:DUF86 domain-containing protein n=1 Tax=Aequorivita aurantiaca TaxID=3053356 RepID=A0ABT8DE26_9FLAO|nr:HepT-like ribonuclease domain-containing protein [Aequorivita aurantiaca]MDN3722784.1 DUF86 domain-containing protein [Aequorivita aurantiaca]
MDIELKTWMFDILQSIEEIESYFEKEKSLEQYQKDQKTKRAVERNLEIIGEAVNRILKKEPDFKLTNSRKIIGTRNIIIHNYDFISDDLIWSIITQYLPDLKKEVKLYLNESKK